ncbi:portal protein [Magnetospirillum moscoviense]|uniref:Phage tail protein n=1 Tax=Magnetospirillum moscoviense TaxID=1437059 RepID=A0A178MRF3_9PROT|nr:portal protein [Magnetospirillum moscoviense]OAN50688.1 hypothetical protein A6A05_11830 [Magnetospirillum moscoviense]
MANGKSKPAGQRAKARDPVIQRADTAFSRRRKWDAVLSETYALCLPGGDPDGVRGEGDKTDTHTYDDTGVRALRERAQRMHGSLYSPFAVVWDFEYSGLPLEDIPPDQRDAARAVLHRNALRVYQAVTNSNFHLEMAQAMRDCLVSTGCISVNPGDPSGRPLVFEALPVSQWAGLESPVTGVLEDVFRKRSVTRPDAELIWAQGKFDTVPNWATKRADDPDEEVEILECQLFRSDTGRWEYRVYVADGEHLVHQVSFASKPIIPFRMDKYTGETMGRGPAMSCRADMKTADKVVELVLKNATIAVTGIWQADDDGVLNPANIKLVPGTIIPKAVGSAGLQPLTSPGNFDVSQLVLVDLRGNINEAIKGKELPGFDQDRPVAYAFLSAERDRAAIEVPEHQRIYFECDWYLVRRIVDILSQPAFIGTPYGLETFTADGSELKPVPANPLVALQTQAEAKQRLQALAEVAMVAPNHVQQEVKLGDLVREHLQNAGFPDHLLYSVQEKQAMAQAAQRDQALRMEGLRQGVAASAKLASTDAGGQLLGQAGQLADGMAPS